MSKQSCYLPCPCSPQWSKMSSPKRFILWLKCAEWSQIAQVCSELVVNSRWPWGASLWSSEGLELLLSKRRFDFHTSQFSPVDTVHKAPRHHHACLQAQRWVGWHEQGGSLVKVTYSITLLAPHVMLPEEDTIPRSTIASVTTRSDTAYMGSHNGKRKGRLCHILLLKVLESRSDEREKQAVEGRAEKFLFLLAMINLLIYSSGVMKLHSLSIL